MLFIFKGISRLANFTEFSSIILDNFHNFLSFSQFLKFLKVLFFIKFLKALLELLSRTLERHEKIIFVEVLGVTKINKYINF